MATNDSSTGKSKQFLRVVTVKALIDEQVIEPPLDGNHGEIHPTAEDYVTDGIPFVMASDLSGGVIDLKGCYFITERQALTLRKGFAKKGDVLLSHKATIGRTAIVGDIPCKFIMLTPQVTYYRVKDEKRLSREYLKYYFDCDFFQKTISQWAGAGSTRAYIGIMAQQKLPVILPPIEVQNKIASILSAYDDLIENNKRRIAILEKMAEEIYREWFVRMRFPGSPLCKQSGRNSTKAKFSKGRPLLWQTLRVKDVVDRLRFGRIYRQEELSDDGKVIVIDQSTADQLGYYDGEPSHCATAEKPILLFGDHSCKMVFMTRPFSLAENVIPFRPAKGVSAYFLFHLIKGLATTTEYKRHWTDLMNREVLLPTSDLQFEYEKVIISTHEQIGLLKELNKILSKSRDLLLPRLISGKLSVEDLELPSNEKLTTVSSALPLQELAHA